MKVSIIIPVLDSPKDLSFLIKAILEQSYQNFEIIIVDTSENNSNKQILSNYNSKIPINYIHAPGYYPGKARNTGFLHSAGELIAFLDVRTIPKNTWLQQGAEVLEQEKNILFGSLITTSAESKYQKVLRASSYGSKPRQALVGCILTKNSFMKVGNFNEFARAGEDLEWLERAKQILRKITWPQESLILYKGLMPNLFSTIKKWYLYSMGSSKINVEINQKYFYFILLIFISWFLVYSWNPIIAGENLWSDSPYFVPHITKIFTALLFIIYFFLRAIYRPIQNGTDQSFLFPFNWFLIGGLGLLLDVVKAPGRILGLIHSIKFKENAANDLNINFKKNKILIVCPYPYGEAAGQRLKYEQYFHDWEKNEFTIDIDPFFSKKTWDVLYKDGFTVQKFYGTLAGYFRRLRGLRYLKSYDKIYVFMWVTPLFGSFFESLYRFFSNKIIFDFDDSIHLYKNANDEKKLTSFLRSTKKTNYLIKNADCVITSSPSNLDYCIQNNNFSNAFYIPCSLNTNRFRPRSKRDQNNKITLGWTGTFSSSLYLDSIKDVLQSISELFDVRIVLITNFDYEIANTDLKVIYWREKTEISDLHEIDIGLYPLIPSEWALGKGGLKVLQYMSLGIPSVSTDFGTAQDIITHGKNGFLARNSSDWIDCLSELILNQNLRNEMGDNARKTIIQKYSVDSVKTLYLNALYSLDKL